ncbi:MAG: NHL repeat-containing protein [Bythopirellula sp.]
MQRCGRILPSKRTKALAIVFSTVLPLTLCCGCTHSPQPEGTADRIWGKPGITSGRLQKPRAIAIDNKDQLYIVDMTARIQVFDTEGTYLRGWKTPISKNGRPSGLTIDRTGRLLVADTHYYRMLVYEASGTPVDSATIGGTLGRGPGEFGFVTDVVEDSQGNFYIGEYGDFDRVQKFSPAGQFLLQWGTHGSELGQFRRPQNMAIDNQDRIWIVDACNHRIQVFDTKGELLFHWGEEGSDLGKLYYPYDLALDESGHIYICEYGNHRVQKFTLDGKSVASWGRHGRGPGELHNPWALALDSQGRLHVLDSNNHRVQRAIF